MNLTINTTNGSANKVITDVFILLSSTPLGKTKSAPL